MTASFRLRRWSVMTGAVLALLASPPATAQYVGDSYGGAQQRDYSYGNDRPAASQGARGYGSGANTYVPRGDTYPPPGGYGANEANTPRRNTYQAQESYAPQRDSYRGGNDVYSAGRGGGSYGGNDAYSPGGGDAYGGGNDAYSPRRDAYSGGGPRDSYNSGQSYDDGGYGTPYTPPPADGGGEAYYDAPPQDGGSTYNQNEIISAGHGFFGAISQGLGSAVEYVFKSQGRPNGYILGEDAGGAFVVGLRYGEGRLYTKDAGDHKVFWQGPTLGYDAGAEGSKTMVLVYNLRDPSEIYRRFGGVEGSAYLVGGVSVVFQKYGDVTLAVIRSGVGVRLGANVGYLKYTRRPTWNPL